MMQVSFKIDAASYAGFRLYSPVVIRDDERSGTVVVTCGEAEVEFAFYQDGWVAQRLGDPIDAVRTGSRDYPDMPRGADYGLLRGESR